MRKFGYYGNREDVWHLVDTVDAQQLVIDRLLDGWQVPTSPHDELYGWWVDGLTRRAQPQSMSRAEQMVLYDRVVRPEAEAWPDDRSNSKGEVIGVRLDRRD